MRKPTRLIAGAIVAIGLMFPATAEAEAACTWQRTEYTLPNGRTSASVYAAAGDYALGLTPRGLVRWFQGQGTELPNPVAGFNFNIRPIDVSANGTVLAHLNHYGVRSSPYVTKLDGTRQFLEAEPGYYVDAAGINSHGDVVGSIRDFDDETVYRTVVWDAEDYTTYRDFGPGGAVGIDDEGAVVIDGLKYLTPEVTRPLQRPDGAERINVRGYKGGAAYGWTHVNGAFQGLVWNADASIRHSLPDGLVYSANSHGTALGITGSETPTLWRNGVQVPLPIPAPIYINTVVTEQETLVGTYRVGNDTRSAEWRCA